MFHEGHRGTVDRKESVAEFLLCSEQNSAISTSAFKLTPVDKIHTARQRCACFSPPTAGNNNGVFVQRKLARKEATQPLFAREQPHSAGEHPAELCGCWRSKSKSIIIIIISSCSSNNLPTHSCVRADLFISPVWTLHQLTSTFQLNILHH